MNNYTLESLGLSDPTAELTEVIQDGNILKIHIRKKADLVLCPDCRTYHTDSFSFVDPYKQTSNRLPCMIAQEMKELNVTAAQVARRFDVSDTYVIHAFMSVVSLSRLPLPDIVCIDEVYMNYSAKKLYPMVLLDFRTGEPIVIVESRRIETSCDYLLSIPIEERKQVRFIICDMYETYTRFAGTIFPNAVAVVDSFHVIAKLNLPHL